MSAFDDNELFGARVLELAGRAGRGEIAVGDFCNPREKHAASVLLERSGYGGRYAFCGGYENAERARLVCLPDYMLYDDTKSAAEIAAEAISEDIAVLRVSGSGYRELSHRDFMGAVLALGIKRHVIGDIIVDEDQHGSYIFCDVKIAAYIAENLTKVASDTVSTQVTALPEGFGVVRKTMPVSDTVASPRADCVVAALVNCPRERAKQLIISGLTEVNYEILYKPDAAIEAGDIISVRGAGKFSIISIDGLTRRGRLRLAAEKYI